MNDETPVTDHPGDLTRPGEAIQLDRATLAATGWSPVGAERQRARPPVTDVRTPVADRSPGRGATPGPAVSGALLIVLTMVAWVVFTGRTGPAVAAAPSGTQPVAVSVPRCSPASARLVAALQAASVQGYRDLRNVSVVKSRAYAQVYFVAGAVAGTGWGAKVGLWATDDPSGGAPIYSVNGNARAASWWPDGQALDAHLSELDDGADVAMACGDG